MATAATGIAPPVIIVGAGPSGLAASAFLARHRVASLVLDRGSHLAWRGVGLPGAALGDSPSRSACSQDAHRILTARRHSVGQPLGVSRTLIGRHPRVGIPSNSLRAPAFLEHCTSALL
ncbi:hypothetical protein QYE76_001146 [Lolium multiflorum]|uniref:Uncharacterized protein n=1 Tax=Lolium multiflorum TaxID=4521 RepID=A0AAD8RN71_LOLMU|nr:hypothetical protein QYE76_001146 [Lolium multiflorum]